jgi:hypothetical protein
MTLRIMTAYLLILLIVLGGAAIVWWKAYHSFGRTDERRRIKLAKTYAQRDAAAVEAAQAHAGEQAD